MTDTIGIIIAGAIGGTIPALLAYRIGHRRGDAAGYTRGRVDGHTQGWQAAELRAERDRLVAEEEAREAKRQRRSEGGRKAALTRAANRAKGAA